MNPGLDLKQLDDWYTSHFQELVEKYPGKAVAIVDGKIVAVGDREERVDQEARQHHPGKSPLVVTVPTEEELICLLSA
jgi:imidazolonepropionase-like amidohydrolase